MSTVALNTRGHSCILQETNHWNMVELVVSGEVVYKCSIQELQFGGDGELDPVCKEAMTAVENAY